MINSIDLIGKHLNRDNLQTKVYTDINEICAFTGVRINEGVKLKDIIGANFNDRSYIKYSSEYASVNTSLCLSNTVTKNSGLRNYHFYCTTERLEILKREHLESYVLQQIELDLPFILAVNYSQKKHISFKSKINYSKHKSFVVSTDKGNVSIDISKLQEIYLILKNWYEIVEGKQTTSQQPTYFTKDDILNGCNNMKRITDYGINKYSYENEIISKFRNTSLLELLVFILNKKGL